MIEFVSIRYLMTKLENSLQLQQHEQTSNRPTITTQLTKPAMRFLTIQRPLLAVASAIPRVGRIAPLGATLANRIVLGQRHASVKSQGAYRKKVKRSIPKKMGAKRTGGK